VLGATGSVMRGDGLAELKDSVDLPADLTFVFFPVWHGRPAARPAYDRIYSLPKKTLARGGRAPAIAGGAGFFHRLSCPIAERQKLGYHEVRRGLVAATDGHAAPDAARVGERMRAGCSHREK